MDKKPFNVSRPILIVRLEFDGLFDVIAELVDGNANLFHGVALTNGNAVIFFGVEVVCDAKGRTDLIFTTVPFADRTGLVEIDHEFFGELLMNG